MISHLDHQRLLMHKPLHWSSFDVVKKIQKTHHIKKVGHAGTLDPLATGLLIICTGNKTKTIGEYQNLNKVYTGAMVLGKTTPSIDLETDFTHTTDYHHITQQQVEDVCKTFQGTITQTPPQYSAVKVRGKRAYKTIRQGESVIIKPKQVTVEKITITCIQLPAVYFQVVCGKGFYIRSLVHDIGKKLGVGAYLAALKRVQIGSFLLKNAWTIEEMIQNKTFFEKK